jgi:hypothetical protein
MYFKHSSLTYRSFTPNKPETTTMYTVSEFIRFLKFYKYQGLTIDEMIKLLESYGEDELSTFVPNQSFSVPSP